MDAPNGELVLRWPGDEVTNDGLPPEPTCLGGDRGMQRRLRLEVLGLAVTLAWVITLQHPAPKA